MKVKIPIDRVLGQVDSKTRADYLKNVDRPNKGTQNDILGFKNYFSGFTLIEGDHGPEKHGSKTYISVYHFMEYEGINPHDFDTLKIGGHLSTITTDYKSCKYKEFPHKINKYDYSFLCKHQSVFPSFKIDSSQ